MQNTNLLFEYQTNANVQKNPNIMQNLLPFFLESIKVVMEGNVLFSIVLVDNKSLFDILHI